MGREELLFPRSNRVTDFSSWIYDLCMGSKRDNAARDGKQGEREFALRRKEEAKRSVFKGAELSSWELIFEDPLDGSCPAKAISSLEIDGRSMFGTPDYVFKEKATGRILILEIKTDALFDSVRRLAEPQGSTMVLFTNRRMAGRTRDITALNDNR